MNTIRKKLIYKLDFKKSFVKLKNNKISHLYL